jgi:hypothetical protein
MIVEVLHFLSQLRTTKSIAIHDSYEPRLRTALYFVSSNGVRGGRASSPPSSSSAQFSATSSIFELSEAIALVLGSRNISLELNLEGLRDALLAANRDASGTEQREGSSYAADIIGFYKADLMSLMNNLGHSESSPQWVDQ